MITLAYELSPEWNRRTTEIELRSAVEATLRYDFFLGDAVLVVAGADFSARWGWVPVPLKDPGESAGSAGGPENC